MAAPVLTGSPSTGSISWTAFSMTYLGVSFNFVAGSTLLKYTYWQYNNGLGSPLQFTNDPTVIAALSTDDCLLFLNRNGLPVNALTADLVYGDLIVPGTILAQNIGAHVIDSTVIKAGGITAQNLTLTSNYALIPNGSFDEIDQTVPTRPAFWTQGSGDGVISMDTGTMRSPGGYSVKMTQTVGANTLTSGEFAANITGWVGTAATLTWQNGYSASGQMKVSIAAAATTPKVTSPSFAVTAGNTYNLLVNIEADGNGANGTAPVAITQQIQWLNSTGGIISTSSYVNMGETQITTAVDAFGVIQQQFTAPAGSVTAKVILGIPSDPSQASLHYIDYVRVRQSTVAEMWSDVIPVTEGEWIKTTFWSKSEVATNDTQVSALHFHDTDPLFTPTNAKVSVTSIGTTSGAATTDFSGDSGFTTTWTKSTGSVQVPPQMAFMRAVLGTEPGTYETVGTYNVWFDDANFENVSSGNIQSSNFVPTVSGWSLNDDGSSQVTDLTVVNGVGADSGTFNTLQLAGQDLQSELLSPLPLGLIAHGTPNLSADTAAVISETILFQFSVGAMSANRVYRVTYGGSVNVATAVANDVYYTRIKYVVDGTTPTLTNGVLDRSLCRIEMGPNITNPPTFQNSFYYLPSQDWSGVNFAFTGGRNNGTGSLQIKATDANLGFYIAVEDMGSRSILGGSFAQVSKAGGVAVDVQATQNYTKVFRPSATRPYDADGTPRLGAETAVEMYQGYYSSSHGNTMSCAVYDWAAISTALAADTAHPNGATNIVVKLTFRVQHASRSTGLNVSVHQHIYSGASTPTTYRPGVEIATKTGCKEGSTYTITLPTSFGAALKAGTAKGIGFGAPGATSTAWFGYMYGYGTGSAPFMTISYTK